MAAVKLGVFGGTFDPPHMGHLLLAEQAREQLDLDRVLWIPASDPWRKAGARPSPVVHRVAMVRLAIAGNEAFELATIEVERQGPSYTVDTLSELHAARPDAELFFLLGEDALADLPNWHEPQHIIELATLAVAARSGQPPQAVTARTVFVEMPRIDVSATGVRTRAGGGRSLRYLVPDSVEAYIRQHALYRRG